MTKMEQVRDNREDILAMKAAGIPNTEISKKYNINSYFLWQFFKEEGVILKKRSDKCGKLTNELAPRIIELQEKGMNCSEIAREIGVRPTSMVKAMNKLGLDTSKFSTQRKDKLINHKEEIIELWENNNLSAHQIAIKFKGSSPCILKILNKAGIDTSKETNGYQYDKDFFEKIDTPEKAWVLGLMYTDGNNKRTGIRLCMTDLDIIEKVHKLLKTEAPIYTKQPRLAHRKIQYEVSIHKQNVSEQLTKLGCPPNKSFILKFPDEDIMSKELLSHFILGILDGDGHIPKRGKRITFTGAIGLLQGIESSLSFLGIKFIWRNRYPEKGPDYPIRSIETVGGTGQILLSWLYQDAKIYGERKYQRAKKWLNKQNQP